jgi:hypothetical protein
VGVVGVVSHHHDVRRLVCAHPLEMVSVGELDCEVSSLSNGVEARLSDADREPVFRVHQTPTQTEARALRRAADAAYQAVYGRPRSIKVHSLARSVVRGSLDFTLTPDRWSYILTYPQNITVFYEEQTDGSMQSVGWQYHHKIKKHAVPGYGVGAGTMLIEDAFLEPMSTFDPDNAK